MTVLEQLHEAAKRAAPVTQDSDATAYYVFQRAIAEIERLEILLRNRERQATELVIESGNRHAKIVDLQAALKKYGRHSLADRCCAVYKCQGLTCDCGWGDVLKTLEEQAT